MTSTRRRKMNGVDDFTDSCRQTAHDEACGLVSALGPRDLTTYELIGLIALLRPALDRLAQSEHRAEVLKLARDFSP